MRVAYQYKLRSNKEQAATIARWLHLLGKQYNYRLGERFDWYQQNRNHINACPLVCHLSELKDNPNYYSQKRNLIKTKELFIEDKDLHSQVLQDVIKRVKITFDRWIKGDSNGKCCRNSNC